MDRDMRIGPLPSREQKSEMMHCMMFMYHSTTTIFLPRRCIAYTFFWLQALRRIRQKTLVYARAHPANFPITLMACLIRIPVVQEINGSYHDVSITHRWLLPFMGLE